MSTREQAQALAAEGVPHAEIARLLRVSRARVYQLARPVSPLVPVDGRRLRRARERAGLSQEALAARSLVTVRTVARLETGAIARLRRARLESLAVALGVEGRDLSPRQGSGTRRPSP